MRWLFGFALLLMALGGLRVMGCGDAPGPDGGAGGNGGSDQTGWFLQDSGLDPLSVLYGVCFTDANTGTAVGEGDTEDYTIGANGIILRTTDGGLTWKARGAPESIYGVSFIDATTGTVVGSSGTIMRTSDGGATWWHQESNVEGFDFQGVSFTDGNNGTIVGDISGFGAGAIILRTTDGGATWTEQLRNDECRFKDVSFIDADNGTAAGYCSTWSEESRDTVFSGIALTTTDGGATWTEQRREGEEECVFEGASSIDANNAVVVGYCWNHDPMVWGIILRTRDGGATWTEQYTAVDVVFQGVSFTDTNNGSVVGTEGTIVRTKDGGQSWVAQNSGTNEGLRSVSFTDAETGTVVGGPLILGTTDGGWGQ